LRSGRARRTGAGMREWRGVILLLSVSAAGCAFDGRPARLVPRICPDGAPVKWFQDPACGRVCGYSCLPDRWTVAP
jgi:hypothetical protein